MKHFVSSCFMILLTKSIYFFIFFLNKVNNQQYLTVSKSVIFQMNSYNFASNILNSLGKPTRRGIKKCSKCGVYNGTRGLICKNKQCGTSLKTYRDNVFDFDAVRLVTGTVRQVYSVRVTDMSRCRGFVQLRLLPSTTEESNSLLSDVNLCFVNSCQRSFDTSILKCHEEGQDKAEMEICDHISLSLKSQALAKPLHFNKSILKQLNITNEVMQNINILAADNDSPLVQRVSKDVMAVKCKVTPKQPLGYLHFTFLKGKNKEYEKFYCTCMEYLGSAMKRQCKSNNFKCIHYYSCIAALSSNLEYFEEFTHFINCEINPSCKIQGKAKTFSSVKIPREFEPVEMNQKNINNISNELIYKYHRKVFKKETRKSTLKQQKLIIKRCKKIAPKMYPIEVKVFNESLETINNELDTTWHFLDWLAFVTESVNNTMQFINCGIVNTQLFYIPKSFFQLFKKRIPVAYPEQSTGSNLVFYNIMNVNHVKEIFDTTKVKLRIAKKFIHHAQKGYIEYTENSENENTIVQYRSSFIFFLNVGQSTVDESDNCNNAFIIEWLPNIYTAAKIGQLKLQYKYGKKSI